MASEKRLIDANALLAKMKKTSRYFDIKFDIEEATTVDAVEVVYCEDCVNHRNCLPEDVFRIARIEKPYCCAGKKDGERNA